LIKKIDYLQSRKIIAAILYMKDFLPKNVKSRAKQKFHFLPDIHI
jgi:hypothetical protein